MTRARGSDFDLAAAIRAQGFTPRADDAAALVALLGAEDEKVAADAERALLKIADAGAEAALAALAAGAKPPLRPRIPRLIGRIAEQDPSRHAAVVAMLRDADAKTRRAAVGALGKLPGAESEAALIAEWRRETRVVEQRAIALALGKAGGAAALAVLRDVKSDDPELSRIVAQSVIMLDRTGQRGVTSAIVVDRAPKRALPVLLRCRDGIEHLLADEIHGKVRSPGAVDVTLSRPLSSLFAARTWLRAAFPLPPERRASGEDLADTITRAITSEAAREIFTTFTDGAVRWRLAWSGGGHKRAVVWRVARAVAARRPELVNDPTESTWEAVISDTPTAVAVELVPRRLDDPRFTYRQGDVPAASHPTLAAALAVIAGAKPDDIVWDPFCGSGSELVERARRGAYKSLEGTDTDPHALDIARANLAAAGVTARLVVGDATMHAPRGATLIITNPPMGRRVHRGDVGPLLDRFIDHCATVLAPGGRLVWLSPLPARTAARAQAAGLTLVWRGLVDMGGFTAELQKLERGRF